MQTRDLEWGRNPVINKLDAFYIPPSLNTTYRFPSDYYETDIAVPLQVMYPMTDSETYSKAHHRVAFTGMKWQCPVRCMGGSNPRIYEIVRAPAGVTLGEFLEVDVNGDYVINDDYGLLTWNTPTAGLHSIVVRCTDQMGDYVVIRFTLLVSVSNHLFIAPTARGAGDGSSYANAIGEASVILNGSTSPALGKVMVLCGGTYTSTNALVLNKSSGAASVIGFPNETAIWKNKIALDNSDCAVGFITVAQVGTSDFGIIRSYVANDRLASFYNTFDSCFNSNTAATNNQSVHGYSSAGAWRQNIVHLNNTYIDCDKLHAVNCFNMDSFLSQCETWITTSNPALLTQTESVWYTKARYRQTEISFNTYDNAHVSGRASGIIQAYNGVDGSSGLIQDSVHQIEYNFIRCSSSENGIFSNGASNLSSTLDPAVTHTNYIRRNTVIGGGMAAKNYDYSWALNRRTFVYNNVLQKVDGANMSITSIGGAADSVWFDNPSMLFGAAVVDSVGKLTAGNSAQRGKKGAQVYKP